MVTITHERSWARDEFRGLQNVTDMQIATMDGARYLYAIDAADGTLTSFDLSGQIAVRTGSVTVDDEPFGTADTIAVMENGGACVILTGGATAGEMRAFDLDEATGAIGARTGGFDAIEGLGSVSAFEVYERAGVEYLAAALPEGALSALDQRGGFSQTSSVSGPETYLDDVTAVQFVRGGFGHYVFAASGTEEGVTVTRAGSGGRLAEYELLDAEDGLWVSNVSALGTVDSLGTDYLLVADQVAGSVSTVRIDRDGTMTVTDTAHDDLETRFGGVSVMETFSMKHRDFVALGGSDGGLTVMEILNDGTLHETATLGGDGMAGLGSISAIEVDADRHDAAIFVSTGDGGMSQFTFDLGLNGTHRAATEEGGVLGGTAMNDLLTGGAGDDRLYGNRGEDLIYDGAGADFIAAGSGADVVKLAFDGETDRVVGFKQGEDRIDLSEWPMLYDMSRLEIAPFAAGARVHYFDETLILTSIDREPLTGLSEADFIFG